MNVVKKTVVLGIVLAGFSAWLMAPAEAHAQASSKCTGTWVGTVNGGLVQTTLRFNGDGSYRSVVRGIDGQVLVDGGRYTIVNGVMLMENFNGERERAYFSWNGPDRVTIRIVSEDSGLSLAINYQRVRPSVSQQQVIE